MFVKTLTGKMANSSLSAQASDVLSVASGVRWRVLLPLAAVMLPLVIAFVSIFVIETRHRQAEDIARTAASGEIMFREQSAEGIKVMRSIMERVLGDRRLETALRDRQRLPDYPSKLTEALAAEQQGLLDEIGQLSKSVEHIKDIVATQQAYAGTVSIVEAVPIPDLLEDALRITAEELTRHQVTAVKDVAEAAELYAGLARRIVADISAPMTIDGHALQVGASLGIACFPEDGADAASLMRHVDTAMYAAKTAGRGTYRCFAAATSEQAEPGR